MLKGVKKKYVCIGQWRGARLMSRSARGSGAKVLNWTEQLKALGQGHWGSVVKTQKGIGGRGAVQCHAVPSKARQARKSW